MNGGLVGVNEGDAVNAVEDLTCLGPGFLLAVLLPWFFFVFLT